MSEPTFNLEDILLDAKDETVSTRQQLGLDCRKPKKQDWVRAHPELFARCAILEIEATSMQYLVTKAALPVADEFCVRVQLFPAITRHGELFLWRCKEPGEQQNPWHVSLLAAVGLARTKWCRVYADTAASRYTCDVATADYGEPSWPSQDMKQLLQKCFQDRVIADPDNEILRQLRGEV